MKKFVHLIGCQKFLKNNGSKWVITEVKCPRDDEFIWQEQLSDGKKIDHFGCSRSGCTWADYGSNINRIKEQLNLPT